MLYPIPLSGSRGMAGVPSSLTCGACTMSFYHACGGLSPTLEPLVLTCSAQHNTHAFLCASCMCPCRCTEEPAVPGQQCDPHS